MKNKLLNLSGFLLVIIIFLLLFLWVKPELAFHAQQLGFSTSNSFLIEYASYPGGLAEYLSLFFFQFLYYPFLGALIYTGLIALLTLLVRVSVFYKRRLFGVVLQFLPLLFASALLTDFYFHPFFILAFLILCLGFWVFKKVVESKLPLMLRLLMLIVLFGVAYYIVGGFMFLILIGSAVLFILLAKKKDLLLIIPFIVILAIAFPFISARWAFFISYHDAFFKLVPYFCKYNPGFLLYCFVFSLPFLIIISQLLSSYKLKENRGRFLNAGFFRALQYVIILLILISGVFLETDRNEKHKLTIDYLAHNRQWNDLLFLAREKPSADRLIQFQINRALYHTGQLPEKMFDYPQEWGVDGLFLTRYFADEVLLPSTELFFDLSFLNEAIHYGNEAMSQNENSPLITEQLILANLAAGKEMSAKLYITELKTYPVFRCKAIDYEEYLEGYSGAETIEKLIQEKAGLKPVTDFIVNRMEPQVDLLNIIRDHAKNKMAYEYLMAFYLMNNDLASFVKYYSLGKLFGYQTIPTIYQEALIIYSYELSRQGKTFAQLNYRKEIIEEFTEYLSILKKYNGQKPDAQEELKQKFGNTYWYYLHYLSPVTTNSKIVVQ